jgi:hypothetical protein
MRGKNKNFFMTIEGVKTEVRRCHMCGEVKKIEEFYSNKYNTKYGVKERLYSYCKDCTRNYYELSVSGRRNHRLSNWKILKIKYRNNPISYDIYEELLEYQEHKCAICGADDSFNRMVVDHDHKTGELRGLLCEGCNHTAVGVYERKGKYRTEHHTEIIRKYLSDPPINHIPTSLKHGWKYEVGVFPSPSEDNEMEEVVIRTPMDIFEEEE